MFSLFFYFILALGACVAGAIAGLGGGIIIKPLLDLFTTYDAFTISLLSGTTVLAMTTVSVKKQVSKGSRLTGPVLLCAGGAALGGLIGKVLFSIFSAIYGVSDYAKGLLSIIMILVILLAMVLASGRAALPQRLQLSLQRGLVGYFTYLVMGIILGSISAFLGIGGGPLNVALLLAILGIDSKRAVFISIFIIFTSQLMSFTSVLIGGDLLTADLKPLIGLIPGGILGGAFGSRLLHKVGPLTVMKVYYGLTTFMLGVSAYNALLFLT